MFQRVIDCAESLGEADIANQFMKQICQACSYLASHNVVHLDIKPENVMCANSSKTTLVKVLQYFKSKAILKSFYFQLVDFGFARKLCHDQDLKVFQGTPEFVSPEVISYNPVSLKTDMWSVGVLAYVLLSGLSPFLGETNQVRFSPMRARQHSCLRAASHRLVR